MAYLVTIALSAADADGTLSTGLVQWGDAQETALSPAQVAQLTANEGVELQHSYANPGDYTIVFQVTDDQSGTSTTDTPLHIDNETPVVALSLLSNTPGTGTVSVMPTVTDDGTAPLTLALNWGDGTVTEGCVSGQSYTHTFAYSHTFTVTALATDSQGAVGSTSLDVYATRTPVLDIEDVSVTGRQLAITINYDTVGAWPDDVELAVTQTHAPFTKHLVPLSTPYGNGVETLVFDVPNEWEDAYVVSMTAHFTGHPAVPSGVLSDSEAVSMTYPSGNTVTIDALTNPYAYDAQLNYSFTDERSTLDTVTVHWGDGQTETMPAGSPNQCYHTYAAQGTYTVTVTATYTDGEPARSASQAVTISVAPALYVYAEPQGDGRDVSITYSVTDPDEDFIGGMLTAQAVGGVVHQLGAITPGYQMVTVTIPPEWAKTDYTITLIADYTDNGRKTAQSSVVVNPPYSNYISTFGGAYGLNAAVSVAVTDWRSTLSTVEARWLDLGNWVALATQTEEQTVTRRMPASGTFTLEVRATYADGEVATTSYDVSAYNLQPSCQVTVVSITRQ